MRIGIIGIDTSHAVAFTELLNDPAHKDHVAGAKVVVAYPGGSADVPLSRDRVDGFTQKLKNHFNVQIVDRPEAVAEACDLVFIESMDGRPHLEQLRAVLPFRRPVFIDKPFAHSTADAKEMCRLAKEMGVPLMSCSSMRYAPALVAACEDDGLGKILACDVFGPFDDIPIPPGLFWYGIHAAQIAFRVLGGGCQSVQSIRDGDTELLIARWTDGRSAFLRGLHNAHRQFGVTIHRQRGAQVINMSESPGSAYAATLAAILRSLPNGKSETPSDELIELTRFLEAGNAARATNGQVEL